MVQPPDLPEFHRLGDTLVLLPCAAITPIGAFMAKAGMRGILARGLQLAGRRGPPGERVLGGTAASYCDCSDSAPVDYDYGTDVTYQDNNVYVNGYSAGTSQQY